MYAQFDYHYSFKIFDKRPYFLWVAAILCKSLDVCKREASQRYLEVLLMEEATVLKTWRIKNKTGRQAHRNRYLRFFIVISLT